MGKHNWRSKVTKTSDCFKWLKNLMSANISDFYFKDLPEKYKDKQMLHRATASGLLKAVEIDNNGKKKWQLNKFEISKIADEDYLVG